MNIKDRLDPIKEHYKFDCGSNKSINKSTSNDLRLPI